MGEGPAQIHHALNDIPSEPEYPGKQETQDALHLAEDAASDAAQAVRDAAHLAGESSVRQAVWDAAHTVREAASEAAEAVQSAASGSSALRNSLPAGVTHTSPGQPTATVQNTEGSGSAGTGQAEEEDVRQQLKQAADESLRGGRPPPGIVLE